jgi:hypothetical protein
MKLRNAFKAACLLACLLSVTAEGYSRASSEDDGDDTALISPPAKPAKGDFGQRMKAIRARKQKGGAAGKKTRQRKVRLGRTPKAPKIPSTAGIGD